MGKSYEGSLETLPGDLAKEVDAATTENTKIAERAIKGIYKAFEKGEKESNSGKRIFGKGKYYDINDKPKP